VVLGIFRKRKVNRAMDEKEMAAPESNEGVSPLMIQAAVKYPLTAQIEARMVEPRVEFRDPRK
jgi:hypothetical protein